MRHCDLTESLASAWTFCRALGCNGSQCTSACSSILLDTKKELLGKDVGHILLRRADAHVNASVDRMLMK